MTVLIALINLTLGALCIVASLITLTPALFMAGVVSLCLSAVLFHSAYVEWRDGV